MHSYSANLYEIECASQHYHRTLENISIWDITVEGGPYMSRVLFLLYAGKALIQGIESMRNGVNIVLRKHKMKKGFRV